MNRKILIAVGGAVLVLGALSSLYGSTIPVHFIQPESRTVYEFIAEDAETRLADEYIVDMPFSGTLERIKLEVGDNVTTGQTIARIDPYEMQHRIEEYEARVDQARAQASGVDVQKPKDEDIESAAVRVREMRDALEVTRKTRAVIELNLAEATKDFERAQGLLAAGAVSQSYLDDAETLYKSLTQDLQRTKLQMQAAEKALEQARLAHRRITGSIDDNEYVREVYLAEAAALEAQLAVLRNDLTKADIKAPVSGPVLEKYVEDSRVLQAGMPLLKLGDVASIEIESDILSEEVTQIRVGDPVVISGKALRGETLEGTVSRIYPAGFEKISSLGIEQQRVKVLIRFDNANAKLRPGTSVDVRVVTEKSENALAVPDRAVFRSDDKWYVFKVLRGRARQTEVQVGLRNDDWAEITSGLSTDDTIVAELKNDLEDGVRVTPLED